MCLPLLAGFLRRLPQAHLVAVDAVDPVGRDVMVLPARLRSSVSRLLLSDLILEEDEEPIACFDDNMLFRDLRNSPKC